MDKKPDNIWRIRNVDDATRKRIRLYALQHDIGVGGAIKELIEMALATIRKYE